MPKYVSTWDPHIILHDHSSMHAQNRTILHVPPANLSRRGRFSVSVEAASPVPGRRRQSPNQPPQGSMYPLAQPGTHRPPHKMSRQNLKTACTRRHTSPVLVHTHKWPCTPHHEMHSILWNVGREPEIVVIVLTMPLTSRSLFYKYISARLAAVLMWVREAYCWALRRFKVYLQVLACDKDIHWHKFIAALLKLQYLLPWRYLKLKWLCMGNATSQNRSELWSGIISEGCFLQDCRFDMIWWQHLLPCIGKLHKSPRHNCTCFEWKVFQ